MDDAVPDEPPPAYEAVSRTDPVVQAGPSRMDFSGPPPLPDRFQNLRPTPTGGYSIPGVGTGYAADGPSHSDGFGSSHGEFSQRSTVLWTGLGRSVLWCTVVVHGLPRHAGHGQWLGISGYDFQPSAPHAVCQTTTPRSAPSRLSILSVRSSGGHHVFAELAQAFAERRSREVGKPATTLSTPPASLPMPALTRRIRLHLPLLPPPSSSSTPLRQPELPLPRPHLPPLPHRDWRRGVRADRTPRPRPPPPPRRPAPRVP